MYEFIVALVLLLILIGPPVVMAARKEAVENRERERRREMMYDIERRRDIESRKEKECESVRNVVLRVHRSLDKQKAAGYGPWLSACLSRRDTPPGVALEALRRVQSELRGFSGRRYDLKELGRAILALEVEMGEWG